MSTYWHLPRYHYIIFKASQSTPFHHSK